MELRVKVIAHSRCSLTGKEILTWELEYPRLIHSEFMTHRLFSRNAASSRAIPIKTILAQVRVAPAMPSRWGQNQPGMQASQDLNNVLQTSAEWLWRQAAEKACQSAEKMDVLGLHKQVVNRVLEPYQWMKTVMTATELDNWFWLRDHTDADPTIHALASLMWKALQASTPVTLNPGDWHVPYYNTKNVSGAWIKKVCYADGDSLRDEGGITLADALAISSSCCAQVSYRKLDDTMKKAKMVYSRLIESEPVHASPFEHQATPMEAYKEVGLLINHPTQPMSWELGVTHVDRQSNLWSANFKGWIQHRQLIKNNACWAYEGK